MHPARNRTLHLLCILAVALGLPGCGANPDAILENLEVIGLTPDDDGSAGDPAEDPSGGDATVQDPGSDDSGSDGPGTDDPSTGEPPAPDGEGGSTGSDPEPDVPDPVVDNCVVAASEDGASFEEQVLDLVNAERAAGADCGSAGVFDPAGPLTMDANLRCAARMHSQDMVDRNYFDHTNPDGESPGDRIDATGYQWRSWGENIAWGQPTPEAVVDAWMNSDGHCSNIMNAGFTEIGVGYADRSVWTQVFASPR